MADGYLLLPFGDLQEQLPPGFRFHPTDEELVTYYLSRKASDGGFSAAAVGEVDLGRCEPWDLPWKGAAATAGKKEWYFFSVRDRKYPAGLRTNRATDAGYWKATGKDKEIRRGRSLVGRKKTLVFYLGRAPKGDKTGWVMHEYRLDGDLQMSMSAAYQNEWVICRVFEKCFSCAAAAADQGGLEKRSIIMGPPARMGSASGASYGTEEEEVVGKSDAFAFSDDPPPPSGHRNMTIGKMTGITAPAAGAAASHVTCFSNAPASHGISSFPSIFSASSSSLISLPHWLHGRGYALNDRTCSTAEDRKETVLMEQEGGRPAGCGDLKLVDVYPPSSSLLPINHEAPGAQAKLPASSTAPSSDDMLLGDLIWDVGFTS